MMWAKTNSLRVFHSFIIITSKRLSIQFLVRLCLVLFFLLLGNAWSEEVELTSSVNKTRVLVGERINLLLTLKISSDSPYRLPILKENLGKFVIKDYQLVKTPLSKGVRSETISYTITVYETGNHIIPSISFLYKDQIISTNPISITVDSVLTGNDGILEPIKSTHVTRGSLYWWFYPGLIFLIGLMAYLLKKFLTFIWTRKELPFYDRALVQIEKLKRDIYLHGITKKNYFKLDRIIRNFFSDNLERPNILSMTSKQILEFINQNISTLRNSHGDFFYNFFSETDKVKFQINEPNFSECEILMQKFIMVVKTVKSEIKEKKSPKSKQLSPPSTG